MPHLQFIFTEHDGPEFQMHDGVPPSWSAGEDPLEDLGWSRRRLSDHA
jgi:hypothetical protein